jgi:hypothetical protein
LTSTLIRRASLSDLADAKPKHYDPALAGFTQSSALKPEYALAQPTRVLMNKTVRHSMTHAFG